MILSGENVDLISAVGDDWDYIFSLAKEHPYARCEPELLPESARRNTFVAFIACDKVGNRLGTVFSNFVEKVGYTIDLFVGEGNWPFIPECFELFIEFMAQITDRVYGYILAEDERTLRLGEVFGFKKQYEAEGYVVTMREF